MIRRLLIFQLFLFALLQPGLAQKGKNYTVFQTDSNIIYDICFTSKGAAIAIPDQHNIKVYSVDPVALLAEFTGGHNSQILSIDIAGDSSILVSGGKDSLLVVWDFVTKRIINTLNHHHAIITSVKISLDNRFLLSGDSNNKVYLYDLANRSLIKEISDHTNDITTVVFSNDGKMFASGSGDKLIHIYNTADSELLATLSGHRNWVREIIFPCDNQIISSGDDSKIITWDISNLQRPRILNQRRFGRSWITGIDAYQDGEVLAVANVKGRIRIESAFSEYTFNLNRPVNKIAFKPHESAFMVVAIATSGKGVIMMNVSSMNFRSL